VYDFNDYDERIDDMDMVDFGDDDHVAFFEEAFDLEDGFDPDGYTEDDYRDLMDRI